MRLLFSAVPAYGHLLPLVPLMEAAVDDGHAVAVSTGAGLARMVAEELPAGVRHIEAGLAPAELARQAAERTGADVMAPTPRVAGEMFGGVLLDTAADAALAGAREWGADVVVSDVYDTVGPLVAAALGVPWHAFGLVAAVPPVVVAEIARAAEPRYAARGLSPVPAASHLDPCPPLLADPAPDTGGVPRHPVRTRAHRRPRGTAPAPPATFTDPSRPTVLVTLGTVFSDAGTLAAIVDAVARPEVNVVATTGLSVRSAVAVSGGAVAPRGEVHTVAFAPLDELLDGVALVVGGGGSGTVLAALSRGVPLVLWPQGADQPRNAERATAAGLAVTVGSAAEIGAAVTTVLGDPSFAPCAGRARDQIAAAPDVHDVLRRVVLAGARSGA